MSRNRGDGLACGLLTCTTRTGYATFIFEKKVYLQCLYNTLLQKECICEHKQVKEIFKDNGICKVILEDGSRLRIMLSEKIHIYKVSRD